MFFILGTFTKYPNGSLQAAFGSRDQMFGRGKAPKFGSDGMISGCSAATSAIVELLLVWWLSWATLTVY